LIGMNLTCVAQAFLNPASSRVEGYAAAVMLSFAAAVVLAPLILYFYRWRVRRLMVDSSTSANTVTQPPRTARPDVPDRGKETRGIEALKLASRERASRLAWSLRIVALVFALVTVSLSLALRWQAASSVSDAPAQISVENVVLWWLIALSWTLLALGIAWPVVILGTANPRFGRWFLLVTLPCLALLLAMPLFNSSLAGQELKGYVTLLIFAVAMCVGLVPRHMRNVVPTLTLSLSLAVIAWIEANILASSCSTCLGLLPIRTRDEALRAGGFIAVLLVVVLAMAFFAIYRMLRALASAYRNKRFSDAQLQVLFWYAAVAGPIAAVIYASQRGPGAPPLAVVIGVSTLPIAIAYTWLTRRLPAPHRPPLTLLLLRVFGQTRRGERLLDSLAASWRFIGPVCMIGGPDLAKASLEPHELAAFLTGKLKQAFVTNEASLDQTLAGLDLEPDPDRRYRVNEVYCAGEIWTHAARQLIELSDAVLIDLREFHANRHGTATELAMLAHLGALHRTIAVIGKTTDLKAVRDAMASPHSSADAAAALRTVSVEDRLDSEEFFAKVIAAAQPAHS
jgi:lipid-A-disaccharide synthase-like uncharacterized protein